MENEIAIKEASSISAGAGVGTAMIQTREMTEIQAMVISAKTIPTRPFTSASRYSRILRFAGAR